MKRMCVCVWVSPVYVCDCVALRVVLTEACMDTNKKTQLHNVSTRYLTDIVKPDTVITYTRTHQLVFAFIRSRLCAGGRFKRNPRNGMRALFPDRGRKRKIICCQQTLDTDRQANANVNYFVSSANLIYANIVSASLLTPAHHGNTAPHVTTLDSM